ncbi:hypothetical protein QQZ08_008529 [Neonectria magnoliae]|uniref:FAD-binding PCMH-type domain-containing protein n=1 Tax=Neonectria magnoliae TaxID=2732573 RepID=A0ABR1HUD6_9HYPO
MLPLSAGSLLALSFVAVTASAATDSLETSDFNITEALLDYGVVVAKIPALVDNAKRFDNGCAAACTTLKFLYGDGSVETKNEAAYQAFTDAYWSSNQADLNPYCIFKPSRATQVSVLVLLSRLTQCPFTAKSGGHATFAGASNVEGGITISFASLKGVTLSKDKKIASIEPGNIWGPVFEELTKSDVTVVGGRLYNIGVGGLTTGGGISFFSNLYGWACDNVDSYEVVLANGLIVKASASQYSDLYWALRGGGNNFGLVVSFNLKTIPLAGGEIWGGSRMYTEDTFPKVTDALVDIINNSPQDPKAGLYVVWAYSGGTKLAIPALYYSQPDAGNATVWEDFNAISSISDTTQNRVLAEWGKETMNDSPPGLREIYYVVTTKVDHDILAFARDAFYSSVPSVADIPGIIPNLVVQGITVPQLQQMKKSGGNALGLDAADGPFFILQLYSSSEAKARGVDNDYVYMNYASQFQDVVATYGASNKAKLKTVAKKYDPQQVFQVLQPGYFKLDRAPIPSSGQMMKCNQTDMQNRIGLMETRKLTAIKDQAQSIQSFVDQFASRLSLGIQTVLSMGNDLKQASGRIVDIGFAVYGELQGLRALATRLERPIIEQHFTLEGAIGRRIPIHLQVITSWDTLEHIIREQFKGKSGEHRVTRHQCALEDHASQAELSRSTPWSRAFRPYQKVNMSILCKEVPRRDRDVLKKSCPWCQHVSYSEETTEIQW